MYLVLLRIYSNVYFPRSSKCLHLSGPRHVIAHRNSAYSLTSTIYHQSTTITTTIIIILVRTDSTQDIPK